jgi:tetratricopeptide (TPR) repeat protein
MVAEAMRLDRAGQVTEAIEAYVRLLESWPGLPNCWYNLGLLQRKAGRYRAALAAYQEALERGISQPEEVHLNRGVVYSDGLLDYEAAEHEIEQALRLNPAYTPALINLANLHEDLGWRDRAAVVYERILAIEPHNSRALARYAGLTTFTTLDDPLIARLRQALLPQTVSIADRANIEFALGRALDGCGAYAQAFETYRSANRHSRESAGPSFREYDLKREEQFVESLIAAFQVAGQGHGPRLSSTAAAAANPTPIFICGMFRSGSTLTEHLLANHPQIRAGGELNFLPRAVQSQLAPFPESMSSVSTWQLETLAEEYVGMLRGLFPHAELVTDKLPYNFLYIGLIKALFPQAKIIYTKRDALDNCLSIYFLHLDQGMSYALDLMDTGHHYVLHRRLMRHWIALFGRDIHCVDYDQLVVDPKSVMQGTLDFLGLPWNDACLAAPSTGRPVKTASVWQVREPLYRRSSGRSGHYEGQLGQLREYLRLWDENTT